MLIVDITSDIDRAISEVGDFFRSQIPFGTSVALNNTAFDVRYGTVNETWPKAFKVRNRALPGVMFRVRGKATKKDMVVNVAQVLDRDWPTRQATGGVKTGRRGGRVAIPAEPVKMRTATGRIRAALKPNRVKDQKGVFSVQKGGKTLVLKRVRKKVNLIYSIVPSARIPKKFMFYEDATTTTLRVFPGYWNLAMNAAIAKSRFR